jgi:malonyl-CoA decarboxylase
LKGDSFGLLTDEESASLGSALPAPTGAASLAGILSRPAWWDDVALRKTAEPVLTRLCAGFLLNEGTGKRAQDPVAHFHLSNGARIERLNMAADTSDKGARESATMMVNYLYDPAKIEDWHEAYAGEGTRTASTAVRRLARGWPPAAPPRKNGAAKG